MDILACGGLLKRSASTKEFSSRCFESESAQIYLRGRSTAVAITDEFYR